MLIHSLEVDGVTCFSDPVRLGPFNDGVNVLHGPNGLGKSSLFRALNAVLRCKHTSKGTDVSNLKPWDRPLFPNIRLEFSHGGHRYRITKTFLRAPSARLERFESNSWKTFSRDGEVDTQLREFLRSDASGRGSSKNADCPDCTQVLWTPQGQLELADLNDSVLGAIHQSVGAQLSSQSRGFGKRMNEQWDRSFTPTGKPKKNSRTENLREHVEKLRQQLIGASATTKAYDDTVTQIAEWQQQLHTRRQQLTSAIEAERSAETRASVCDTLRLRQNEQLAHQAASSHQAKELETCLGIIRDNRAEKARLESEKAQIEDQLPILAAEAQTAERLCVEAKQGVIAAEKLVENAEEDRLLAEGAQRYKTALEKQKQCTALLAEVAAKRAEAAQLEAALHRIPPTPTSQELQELRTHEGARVSTEEKLALARVSATFTPQNLVAIDVKEGSQPGLQRIAEGQTIHLDGSPNLSFEILGVGRFSVKGPVSDFGALQSRLKGEQAWLESFSQRFGSRSIEILEERFRDRERILGECRNVNTQIVGLLRGTTEQECARTLDESNRIVSKDEKDHPSWTAIKPDAQQLSATAMVTLAIAHERRRSAQDELAKHLEASHSSAAALSALKNRRAICAGQRERVEQILLRALADNLTDEERSRRLQSAQAAYKEAAAETAAIEEQIKQLGLDGFPALEQVKKHQLKAQESYESVQKELSNAEGRLRQIALGNPYTLEVQLEEELARKQEELKSCSLQDEALRLLHQTFKTVQNELLASVADPVASQATHYLNQLGDASNWATIRLNSSFGSEGVVPLNYRGTTAETVQTARMSGGEQELIYLCTRLALARTLAEEERQLVVLDDILTMTDPLRMKRVCALLANAADRLQIVILTCHPDRFAAVPGANFIDLESIVKQREFIADVA